MRVEKTAGSSVPATAALPLPALSVAPIVPPLATSSSSPAPVMLALPSSTSSPSPPLPSQPTQKLSYEQLLADYQQACNERDTATAQLEKLKEKSLQLSVDTAANSSSSSTAALPPLAAASPSPRSHHLTTFPPASPPRSPSSSSSPRAALNGSSQSAGSSSSLQSLRDKHGLIQSTIGTIQHKTARILHDQERELIRAFRLRLTTLTAELDAERQRSASGSAEWVSRCKRLSEEMEWLRGLVEELGEENKGLGKEVRRMRKAMRVQEEDRDFLIRQLVQLKRQNAKIRMALDRGGVAGDGRGVNGGGTNLPMLGASASANEAAAAIKEWVEDEEKTAVS